MTYLTELMNTDGLHEKQMCQHKISKTDDLSPTKMFT